MAKTICICASANFYEHVNQVADQLKDLGFTVVAPEMAEQMRAEGNYDTVAKRTWLQNPNDFGKKRRLMDIHFKKISECDVVLVVNDEKKQIPGYIGANVLMEMAVAYWLKKPVYVLNDVDANHPTYEEVMAMEAVQLHGDISTLASLLA